MSSVPPAKSILVGAFAVICMQIYSVVSGLIEAVLNGLTHLLPAGGKETFGAAFLQCNQRHAVDPLSVARCRNKIFQGAIQMFLLHNYVPLIVGLKRGETKGCRQNQL